MTTTAFTSTTTRSAARTATSAKALLGTGALAVALGAVAAEGVALIARAFDSPLRTSGFGSQPAEAIPTTGFAVATLMFGVLGVALAFAFRRWASSPARTFARTCVALTVLSCVPVFLANNTAASTRVALTFGHIAAAAVIIPLITRRLADR